MTHILVLILAALMVAVSATKAFCEKVYSEASSKAAELSKKQGGKENE